MQKRSSRYALECFENPKVYNPYVFHRPFVFRWKGSVIPKVFIQSMIVTILSAIITYLFKETTIKLSMKPSFISVLGIVVSLLLAYRTNTAYDRYWEGRRTWSNMVVAIRNMTRGIWVNINVEDNDEKHNIDDKTKAKHLVEKKTAINLLLGFAVATKHYLREEPVKLKDLKPLISNTSDKSRGIIPIGVHEDHLSETSKISNGSFSEKLMKNIKNIIPPGSNNHINQNLPYELTLYISSYIRRQQIEKTTDDSTIGALYSNLGTLTDCLSTFERILRSPIPLAYAIHLTQVTWIYCLSLPFQLVEDLEWVTIPVTFLITMTLFGVEKIASEIENPFGWDENDLDLDGFCGLLNRELNHVTSEPIPPVYKWIFTEENTPFETRNVNALQARDLELDEVRSLLNIETTVENAENENTIDENDPNNNNNNNNDHTVVRME